MDHTSGVVAKKYLPNPSHKSLTLLFFIFRSFIVLDFLFRSIIHFELIFMYIEKYGLKFIFLACGYLIVAALFVEKNPLSTIAFALILKISCPYMYWFSSGLYFLITVALKSLKIRLFKSSNFVFLIQSCYGYLGSFASLFEFRIRF